MDFSTSYEEKRKLVFTISVILNIITYLLITELEICYAFLLLYFMMQN